MKRGNEQVYAILRMQDDKVIILGLLTRGRGVMPPQGAYWTEDGWWEREAKPENFQNDITRLLHVILLEPERGYRGPVVSIEFVKDPPAAHLAAGSAFRPSWRYDGSTLFHDMQSAREGYCNYLRRVRAMKLIELDGEWMKAFATGDLAKAAEVEKERQMWRDAPADPRIESAQTVEELKQIVPAIVPALDVGL